MKTLWHITLPQIRPVLMVNVILITIATLNTFDMILSLTGGGPAQATEVLALSSYNCVFMGFNLAGGCVFAVLLLVGEPGADRLLPPAAAGRSTDEPLDRRRRSAAPTS